MSRHILASVCVAVLACTAAAFAQAPAPLLTWRPVSRVAFLSLDAVQAQVDATVEHAAISRVTIAAALAPPPLLTSTPIPRR